jgi:hypothetical protein
VLHSAARSTDLPAEFQQGCSCENAVIDESGGKNIKNPFENSIFLLQADPQDVRPE